MQSILACPKSFSLLGLTLFLFYINDLHTNILSSLANIGSERKFPRKFYFRSPASNESFSHRCPCKIQSACYRIITNCSFQFIICCKVFAIQEVLQCLEYMVVYWHQVGRVRWMRENFSIKPYKVFTGQFYAHVVRRYHEGTWHQSILDAFAQLRQLHVAAVEGAFERWFPSRVSQLIMPFISHQPQTMSFFWCRSGFVWVCAVIHLFLWLLLRITFGYRYPFSSVVTTLFSQSKQWFLVSTLFACVPAVDHCTWEAYIQIAEWAHFLKLMPNLSASSGAVNFRLASAQAHKWPLLTNFWLMLDMELATMEFPESITGRAMTNCVSPKYLGDTMLLLFTIGGHFLGHFCDLHDLKWWK